jgi:hypothetical protein
MVDVSKICEERKTDSHGGVFILVSDKYLSSKPTDLKSDDSREQLWVKLQVKGAPDLYMSSFYKPSKLTDWYNFYFVD